MLAEAITAVPELGNLCSSVLTDYVPGSGLKTLRLVNKQISAAMLRVVQGYTLSLDGSFTGLPKEISLLQDARLSVLRVVVPKHTAGRLCFCRFSIIIHQTNLQSGLSGFRLGRKTGENGEFDTFSERNNYRRGPKY